MATTEIENPLVKRLRQSLVDMTKMMPPGRERLFAQNIIDWIDETHDEEFQKGLQRASAVMEWAKDNPWPDPGESKEAIMVDRTEPEVDDQIMQHGRFKGVHKDRVIDHLERKLAQAYQDRNEWKGKANAEHNFSTIYAAITTFEEWAKNATAEVEDETNTRRVMEAEDFADAFGQCADKLRQLVGQKTVAAIHEELGAKDREIAERDKTIRTLEERSGAKMLSRTRPSLYRRSNDNPAIRKLKNRQDKLMRLPRLMKLWADQQRDRARDIDDAHGAEIYEEVVAELAVLVSDDSGAVWDARLASSSEGNARIKRAAGRWPRTTGPRQRRGKS